MISSTIKIWMMTEIQKASRILERASSSSSSASICGTNSPVSGSRVRVGLRTGPSGGGTTEIEFWLSLLMGTAPAGPARL